MSSTLCIRRTPVPPPDATWTFGLPFKAMVARRFYEHDGSCGGPQMTIGANDLGWFEGVYAAACERSGFSADERRQIAIIVAILREGGTIDMWFEV